VIHAVGGQKIELVVEEDWIRKTMSQSCPILTAGSGAVIENNPTGFHDGWELKKGVPSACGRRVCSQSRLPGVFQFK
jgi:hypothetical protein